MAENLTNELLLEQLKAIRGELSHIREEIAEIKEDNRAHRTLTSGLLQTDNLHGGQIGAAQIRLDRIERRLSLNDG